MNKNLSSMMKGNYMINIRLFIRMGKLHAILSREPLNVLLAFALLAICGLEQYVGYHTGLVASQFYLVLINKDLDGFLGATLHSLGIILGMALVKTLRMYNAKILSVLWRKTLTQRLHSLYFSSDCYYRVNVLSDLLGLDNPDQRMTSDVETFCMVYGEMIARLIISPFTIGYYTWDAYTRAGWIGPCGVFIYFAIGCTLNLFLMSPVSQRVFVMEKNEGNLRYKHMFIRKNAEEIAFVKSAQTEKTNTNKRLDKLIRSQAMVYTWELLLDLWTNTYDYVGAILSYLIIAVPVFMHYYDSMDEATLGQQISQNSFVCMMLIYNLSQIVDLANKFANMSGVTHRIIELLEIMEIFSSPLGLDNPCIVSGGSTEENNGSIIVLSKASISTPDAHKRLLIKELSLSVRAGSRLLIRGPSASGKTSLFRVIRGLWSLDSGSLVLGTDKIQYLSQTPLLCEGSLLDNMTYPSSSSPLSKGLDWFSNLMHKFRLGHLTQQFGLNSVQSQWENILSPGEMQRLCLIRVLYHEPAVVLLDESTSSLPIEDERDFYDSLMEMLPMITILSVGHRDSLRNYHDSELCLLAHGEWVLQDICK